MSLIIPLTTAGPDHLGAGSRTLSGFWFVSEWFSHPFLITRSSGESGVFRLAEAQQAPILEQSEADFKLSIRQILQVILSLLIQLSSSYYNFTIIMIIVVAFLLVAIGCKIVLS